MKNEKQIAIGKDLLANLLFIKKPHRWNMTKLLMTGFECPGIFVIRCSGKTGIPKVAARH